MKQLDPIYKSAEELGITEQERKELIEAIPYFIGLEPDKFSMLDWNYCICGHIGRLNGRMTHDERMNHSEALSGPARFGWLRRAEIPEI
jgi:hypothetical protein